MKNMSKWFWAFVITLVALVVTIGIAIFAGGNTGPGNVETPGVPEGPETGAYYYDDGAKEYTLDLYDGNRFTLYDGVRKYGSYTADGGKLAFTFDKENNGTATAVFENGIVTMSYADAEIRFLAKVDYTVSFETNGATAIPQKNVRNGKTLQAPADPVKEGYGFVGWYTDAAFTTPFHFDSGIISANTTLYARFLEKAPTEYRVTFEGAEAESIMTINGMVYNLPVPEKDGYTFGGWWISMYEDGQKLSYQCIEGTTVIDANTTLFALWVAAPGQNLAAPLVQVSDKGLSWAKVEGATAYKVKITDPKGTVVFEENVPATTQNFDFAAAGGYIVEVTATAAGKTSETTTRYYHAKALSRVSVFEVVDSNLIFNAVAGAEKYVITVECGNKAHNHTNVNNGKSTVYNFANCQMVEGGIRFTVIAVAQGYADSVATTFVYERKLDAVSSIRVENDQLVWSAVPHAMQYLVEITDAQMGTTKLVVNGTMLDMKQYAGDITVKVQPITDGYLSPESTSYTYTKANLATPGNVTINGNTVVWDAVNGANGYMVKIGANEYETAVNSFDLSEVTLVTGELFEISVKAVSDNKDASQYSDVLRGTYATIGGEVYYEGSYVYWTPVVGNGHYEVQVGNNAAFTVEAGHRAPIRFTESGNVTIAVRYVEGNKASEWVSTQVQVYTITFDSRLGSGVEPLYLAYGDRIVLPTNVERAGYAFSGWYNTPGAAANNGALFTGEYFKAHDSFVLYANWEAKTYNITINVDAGVVGATNGQTITVQYGQSYTMPVPSSDAGMFLGWYTATGGSGIQLTDDLGICVSPYNTDGDLTAYPYFAINVLEYVALDDGTWGVKKGVNCDYVKNLVIPDTYEGKPITVILENAFTGAFNLTYVSFPNTVTIVGTGAFTVVRTLESIEVREVPGNHEPIYSSYDGALIKNDLGVSYLEFFPRAKGGTFTIPEGVQSIRNNAFRYCYDLTELIVSKTVTNIADKAFFHATGLEKITFEEGGTTPLTIADDAFFNATALRTLHLPARIANVSAATLDKLTSLEHISVEAGGETYASVDGLLTNGFQDTILYAPSTIRGTFEVPVGIIAIGDKAFVGRKGITAVVINNKVQRIGESAFADCTGIRTILFEGGRNNDLNIGASAFQGCTAANAITFEGNNIAGSTAIGASAFEGCVKVKNLIYAQGSNVTTIGAAAFRGCTAINSVSISATTTKVGDYAYQGCSSISKVLFESSGADLEFGAGVFADCQKLRAIALPANVTSFDGSVFDGCDAITDIEVDANNPALVAVDGVLYNKALTEVMYFPRAKEVDFSALPATLTKIGAAAFQNNTKITKAVIPAGITEIGDKAFDNCINMTEVVFNTDTVAIGAYAFSHTPALTAIDLPANTTSIGDYAFYLSAIQAIEIPASTTAIGNYAFANTTIAEVTIPAKVATVGEGAFSACKALTAVTFLDGANVDLVLGSMFATETAVGVFDGCSALKTVTLSKNVQTIGTNTFKGLSALETVTIPNGSKLEIIGDYAFSGTSITAINLPEGLTTINKFAFSNANQLAAVVIPSTVSSIGLNAFEGNSALTSATFAPAAAGEKEVELTISSYAFSGASALTEITLPKRLVKIYDMTIINGLDVPDIYTVFEGCNALAAIHVEEGHEDYMSIDGIFYNKDRAGEPIELVFCPRGKAGDVVVPSSVVLVHNNAFMDTLVTGIAFEEKENWDGVPSLTIGSNVVSEFNSNDYKFGVFGTAAASNVMTGNKALGSIKFPAHLKAIKSYAFNHLNRGSLGGAAVTLEFNTDAKDVSINAYAFNYCYGLSGDIKLPALKELGMSAFNGASLVTSYEFKEGSTITQIGELAFSSNTSLVSVINIPKSVTKLGLQAFGSCENLESVSYEPGSQLQSIANKVFYGCKSLKSFTFPESVTACGSDVFVSCDALESITLSANFLSGVSGEGASIFRSMPGLKEIIVPEENPYLTAVDGVLFSKDMTVLYIFPRQYDMGEKGYYEIPATVTSIEPYAFEQYKGSKLDLPEGLIKIGDYAFSKAQLKQWHIPASVQEMGSHVFDTTTSIVSVTFGQHSQLRVMGEKVFYNCISLENIELPDSLEEMGMAVFEKCTSLTSMDMPTSLKVLPYKTFSGCKALEQVTLHEGLEKIEAGAFENCSALKTLAIPASVKAIESIRVDAYSSTVKLPFAGCASLESVTIADGSVLSDIQADVFSGLGNITSLTLPASLKTLPASLFGGCVSLQSVTILGDVTEIPAGFFQNLTSLTEVNLPASVEIIGDNAFAGCVSLSGIELTDSLQTIGTSAFAGCANIQSVYIGSAVTQIGNYAFDNCTKLATVVFGADCTITSLGSDADVESAIFRNTAIEEIILPDTVEVIGANVFQGAPLRSVNIPSALTVIGNYAFAGAQFAEFKIGANIVTIGDYAFEGCGELVNIAIPEGVIYVGAAAFKDCVKLQSANIPSTASEIAGNPFVGCTSLVNFSFNEANMNYVIVDGVLYDVDLYTLIYYLPDNTAETFTVPSTVHVIAPGAFCGSQLKSFVIPDFLKEIPEMLFMGSKNLESVIIPDSITAIGASAFRDCVSLKNITVPASVTAVGDYAFANCTSMNSVTFADRSLSLTLGAHAFNGCKALTVLDIPEEVTAIGAYTFANTGILQIVLPSKITNLDLEGVFYGCTDLASVTLPSGAKGNLGSSFFAYCQSLEEIKLPTGITTLTPSKSVTSTSNIGAYRTDIYSGAFYGCTSLKSIDLSKIVNIGAYAFYGCESLNAVTFGSTMCAIGDYAFAGCTSLKSIDMSKITKSSKSKHYIGLGDYLFKDCTSLESIKLPKGGSSYNVYEIKDGIFEGCTAVKTVEVYYLYQLGLGATPFDKLPSTATVTFKQHNDKKIITLVVHTDLLGTGTITEGNTQWYETATCTIKSSNSKVLKNDGTVA